MPKESAMPEVALVILIMICFYVLFIAVDNWLHDDDGYFISREQLDKIINKEEESKHEDNSSSTGS